MQNVIKFVIIKYRKHKILQFFGSFYCSGSQEYRAVNCNREIQHKRDYCWWFDHLPRKSGNHLRLTLSCFFCGRKERWKEQVWVGDWLFSIESTHSLPCCMSLAYCYFNWNCSLLIKLDSMYIYSLMLSCNIILSRLMEWVGGRRLATEGKGNLDFVGCLK